MDGGVVVRELTAVAAIPIRHPSLRDLMIHTVAVRRRIEALKANDIAGSGEPSPPALVILVIA